MCEARTLFISTNLQLESLHSTTYLAGFWPTRIDIHTRFQHNVLLSARFLTIITTMTLSIKLN